MSECTSKNRQVASKVVGSALTAWEAAAWSTRLLLPCLTHFRDSPLLRCSFATQPCCLPTFIQLGYLAVDLLQLLLECGFII